MSDLVTDEVFTDAQKNIAATNMNGIIGRARVQPDVIANKVQSATMDVADQLLVLKTDNTLARARFDTIVNSTGSALALADATKNGMLRQVSGVVSDYVGGDNQCHPLSSFLPPGVVVDYAGPTIPGGWLKCDGASYLRSTYSGLYAAIGTTYGSVDGTHFNVPNYQGKILAGAGGSYGALGTNGGAAAIALSTGNLPSHSHPITDVGHAHTVPAHSHTASDSGHTHAVSGNATTIGVNAQAPVSQIAYFATTSTGVGFANITVSQGAAQVVSASGTGLSTTQAVGSGAAFSILPPYQTTYKMIKT